MILASIPIVIRLCLPPPVSKYIWCRDLNAQCQKLAPYYHADGFPTLEEASIFASSLLPEQKDGVQILTMPRASDHLRYVVLRRATDSDVLRRREQAPIRIITFPIPSDARGWVVEDVLMTERAKGMDAALVTTNDPEFPYVVLSRVSGECPTTRKHATGR